MSFTREEWSRDFLVALGNSNPAQSTVDWVIGWTCHETATDTGALYNLLNTTQHAPGSTTFNSVGVQNFVDYQQGVDTNALVLGQPFTGYAELKQALLSNDMASLDGPSDQVRQGLQTWCGGCGYGVGFTALGASHRGDIFTYGSGGNPVAVPQGPFYKVTAGQDGVPASGDAVAAAMGLSWEDILAIPGQNPELQKYDPAGPYLVGPGSFGQWILLPGFPPPATGTAKLVITESAITAVIE